MKSDPEQPTELFIKDFLLFCYFTDWDQYNENRYKFATSDIDPFICTHIIYAFAQLNKDFMIANTEWNHKKLYRELINLKLQNPYLKIILSVGGWSSNQSHFSALASHPVIRRKFAKNLARYLYYYEFDGVDIDWEYPGFNERGGQVQDKRNLNHLLKDIRTEFDTNERVNQASLLLILTGSANTDIITSGYDILYISRYIDFITVMTYDYNGCWDTSKLIGYLSPYNDLDEKEENVHKSLSHWMDNGMAPHKILVGIAAFGRSYITPNIGNQLLLIQKWRAEHRTSDKKSKSMKPIFLNCGKTGVYKDQPGYLLYSEICENINYKNWSVGYDNMADAPFAYSGDQFVSYENEKSIVNKVINF
ncbi:unnamed protein product [Gordionus sp. m RMFG-2023]